MVMAVPRFLMFFCVNSVLLNSEVCGIDEVSVVDEDYVWVDFAVCIVKSESFVMPVIDVLDNCDFVSVQVSFEFYQINLKQRVFSRLWKGFPDGD